MSDKYSLVLVERDALDLISKVIIFDILENCYYEIRRYLLSVGFFRGECVNPFSNQLVANESIGTLWYSEAKRLTKSLNYGITRPAYLMSLLRSKIGETRRTGKRKYERKR